MKLRFISEARRQWGIKRPLKQRETLDRAFANPRHEAREYNLFFMALSLDLRCLVSLYQFTSVQATYFALPVNGREIYLGVLFRVKLNL